MAEFVDSTLKDIDERVSQLEDELNKLRAARAALAGSRRGPGRPRGSRGTGRGRGRARGSGRGPGRPRGRRGATRATQALQLVKEQPGITIPKIAETLKIEPNYLYRVMPRLVEQGSVRRDGQGWHPAE